MNVFFGRIWLTYKRKQTLYLIFVLIVSKKQRQKEDETKENIEIDTDDNCEEDIILRNIHRSLSSSILPDEINCSSLTKEQITILLDSSTIGKPTNIKATLNCNYFSSAGSNEINGKKSDVLTLIYKKDDWVYAKNKKGAGFIPFSYCTFQCLDDSGKYKKLLKKKLSKKDSYIDSKEDITKHVTNCDVSQENKSVGKKKLFRKNSKNKLEKKNSQNDILEQTIKEEENEQVRTDDTVVNNVDEINKSKVDEISKSKVDKISKSQVDEINKIKVDEISERKEEDVRNESKVDAIKESKVDTIISQSNNDGSINNSNDSNIENKGDIIQEANCRKEDDRDKETEIQIVKNVDSKEDIKSDSAYDSKSEDLDNDREEDTVTESSEASSGPSIVPYYTSVESKDSLFSELTLDGSATDTSETSKDLFVARSQNVCGIEKVKLTRTLSNIPKKPHPLYSDSSMKRIKAMVRKKMKRENRKTSKSNGSSSLLSTNATKWSGNQVEWYSNLFSEDVSSSSSESDGDYTSTTDCEQGYNSLNRMKKTDIRGRISVDFALQQRKYYNGKRRNSDTSSELHIPSCLKTDTADSINSSQNTITSSGYAQIRKTQTLENNSKDDNSIDKIKDSVEHELVKTRRSSSHENLRSKKERVKCGSKSDSEDVLHSPLVIKKSIDPDNLRRQHKLFSDEMSKTTESTSGKRMLVSYDFIASEENDVTILTGQYVHVLKKPDEDWWWVRTANGREGFVPTNFLTIVPTIPSRKPDLLQKLNSKPESDTDYNNNTAKNTESKNAVTLHNGPMRYSSSESPRLAKVAPYIRDRVDLESEEKLELFKEQYQKQQYVHQPSYKPQAPFTQQFLPQQQVTQQYHPPSYDQYIMHRQHTDLMETFCNSTNEDEYQRSIKGWKSQENFPHHELSEPPRIVRRKSFSGRQKKVRFSNSVEYGYENSPGQILVIQHYDLEPSTYKENKFDDDDSTYDAKTATWC